MRSLIGCVLETAENTPGVVNREKSVSIYQQSIKIGKSDLSDINSASVIHIPIEQADDVNKLFVIPGVVVSLAIVSLLSASITQQYTMKRLPCVL